jgi:hypothetical protein
MRRKSKTASEAPLSDNDQPSGTEAKVPDDLPEIRALPREVGVLLMIVGIGGLLTPGPVGSPFLIMGGVVLWPRLFARVESAFERKFPTAHRQSMKQLHRFINDLERRYPSRPSL